MNATADYAAARAFLSSPLPAYVSYTVSTHAKFDAVTQDGTKDVVVRIKDRTILKGRSAPHPPYVQIGDDKSGGDEPITDPAFVPSCYAATGARLEPYDGRTLEAIALRDTCAKSSDDKDFDTLFVEPATREPVAAVGTQSDEHVAVRLEQQFAAAGDAVLPSSLYVRVRGSGLMSWLDILFDQHYQNYRFGTSAP